MRLIDLVNWFCRNVLLSVIISSVVNDHNTLIPHQELRRCIYIQGVHKKITPKQQSNFGFIFCGHPEDSVLPYCLKKIYFGTVFQIFC